ncbi:hypothetical protein D3C81_1395460 [compost metagenome]
MITLAPLSRAPATAHRPIGPSANTATLSPILTSPRSAPENPVDMMSGHISTCSSLSPSGIGHRLAKASGTKTYSAWQPSMMLPNFQPPVARKPWRVSGPSWEPQPHRQA